MRRIVQVNTLQPYPTLAPNVTVSLTVGELRALVDGYVQAALTAWNLLRVPEKKGLVTV